MSDADFFRYYVLFMHTMILSRIFLSGLTAYVCFWSVRLMDRFKELDHGLDKVRAVLAGLGVFHALVMALGVFMLIVDDFRLPDYIHATQTIILTLGIIITSIVTIRLCLYITGVVDHVDITDTNKDNTQIQENCG